MSRLSRVMLGVIGFCAFPVACNTGGNSNKSGQSPQVAPQQGTNTKPKQTPKSDETDQAKPTNPEQPTATNGAVDRGVAANILGSWESNCIASPDGTQSLRMRRDYAAKDLQILLTSFNDGSCSRAIVEQRIFSSYTIGSASGAVPGAYEFDGQALKTTSKFLDQAIVTTANQNLQSSNDAGCRAVVYRLNQDVEDTPCSGKRNEYSLVQISGPLLKIGECVDTNACQAASSRATKISTLMEFTKKN